MQMLVGDISVLRRVNSLKFSMFSKSSNFILPKSPVLVFFPFASADHVRTTAAHWHSTNQYHHAALALSALLLGSHQAPKNVCETIKVLIVSDVY